MVGHAGSEHHACALKIKFDPAQFGAVDAPRAVAVDGGAFVGTQVDQFVGAACSGDANFAALRAFDVNVVGVFDVAGGSGRWQVFCASRAVCLGVDAQCLCGRRGR